ncbi:MAG: gluconate 2-dehydrogenase subunit 3 family protein [Acidobacteriota bacterium]
MATTRREVLVTIAATGVAAGAAAQESTAHQHPGHDETAGGAPANTKPKVLNAAEFSALGELVEMIIPRSDTPGAKDAGAHLIIDSMLVGQRARAMAFRKGLAPFVKLENAKRLERLTALHQSKDEFFRTLKDMTIDAYYSTREGLVTELGWSGYTALAEFKGCTHPEHQMKA